MKFVINLIKIYKSKVGYKILSQLENDDFLNLKNITKYLLDALFDIDLDSELENQENVNEDEESENSESLSSEEDNYDINGVNMNNIRKKLIAITQEYYEKIVLIIFIMMLTQKKYVKKVKMKILQIIL